MSVLPGVALWTLHWNGLRPRSRGPAWLASTGTKRAQQGAQRTLPVHILIGALAGALFAVAVTVGMSLITGRKPTWKQVLLAGLGGAVGGAIGAATLGAGGMAGATIARQAVAFAAGGAGGGASERVADNAIVGRPIGSGVVRATVVGAGTGLVSLGSSKLTSAVLGKVAPNLAARWANGGLAERPATLPARIIAAPVPGTGSGYISWWDRWTERREAARRKAAQAEPPSAPSPSAPSPPSRGMADVLRSSQQTAR
jgi:hypothetical protein